MPCADTWPSSVLCRPRAVMERRSCSGSSRMTGIAGFPPAVRGILDVLARQYGAIGTEIASIDKSIMALHRACEASRRLAEIPGIGPVGATALVAEIGDWNAFGTQSCGLDRVGAEAAHDRRQGQARQH